MATTIKLKNSVTATNAPSSLVQGEVAINVTDKKVWVGNAATTPIQLLGGGADGSFTNISVSGVASFADGTVSLPSITNIGDTNTGIFFPAADTIAFTEGGVESMRITSAGFVGIGTASPNDKLDVNGVDAFIRVDRSNGEPGITMRYNGSSTNRGDILVTSGGAMYFTAGGSTERMRITSTGDVGIGTSSPAAVTGFTTDRKVVQVTNNGYGQLRLGAASGTMLDHDDSGNTITTLRSLYGATNAAAQMQLQSGFITFGTGTSYTERMRIPSGGGLLVGSTSDSLSADGFRITSATGQFGGITMTGGAGDGPQWQMINLTDAGTVPNGFRWLSFRIGSGAIEIGKIEKASSTSVAYTTTSDYRLKENVEPLSNALARVAALKPVKWKWKNQNDGGEGFIAHELSEICPLAVTGKKDAYEKDGVTPRYQGVDTSFLVATLTAAIQELKAELDSVKAELQTLKGN